MSKKIILIFLIALASYFAVTVYFQPKIKSVLRVAEPSPIPTTQATQSDKITYNCEKNKTALDLLKEKVTSIETKDYSFGKLVTGIGNLKGGADGKYWTYFVDDNFASVSADYYRCQNNEKIEWKFGKEAQ